MAGHRCCYLVNLVCRQGLRDVRLEEKRAGVTIYSRNKFYKQINKQTSFTNKLRFFPTWRRFLFYFRLYFVSVDVTFSTSHLGEEGLGFLFVPIRLYMGSPLLNTLTISEANIYKGQPWSGRHHHQILATSMDQWT